MLKVTPLNNSLLQTLTVNEYNNVCPFLEQVDTFLGEVLYEADEESRYIYFPTSSVISLFIILENGGSSEIAVMDNRSGVGLPSLIKNKPTQHMAIVTKSGIAYRLEKHLLSQKLKSLMLAAFRTKIYQFNTQVKVNSFAA